MMGARASGRAVETDIDRRLLGRSSRPVLIAMVAVRVGILLITIAVAHGRPLHDGDIQRFERIATTPGTPYRDFPVEYAPIETIAIRMLGGDGIPTTASRVAVVWFVCDLAAAAALWWAWGSGAALAYLVLGLPLLTQMSLRLDPIVVALATWGFALLRRQRERAGGVVLALAVLTKLWPLFLGPALLIERRRRALAWFTGALATGGLVWMLIGGENAPRQVLLLRGATGWHIQSAVGIAVWIVTGGPTRSELNAIRVGVIPGWAHAVLLVSTFALVAAIWIVAASRRHRGSLLGAPPVALLAGTIVLSPVFSNQYVSWLTPWAGIAAAEDGPRWIPRTVFAVACLTGLLGAVYDYGNWWATGPHIPVIKLLLVAVNGMLLGLPVLWFRGARRRERADDRSP